MRINITMIIALLGTPVVIYVLICHFDILDTYTESSNTLTDNVLIVGTNATCPPFSFVDIATRKITGIDIDIVHEISKRMGKKIKLLDMQFDGLLLKLNKGGIHIIASDITPTEQRAKHMFLSKPYITRDPLLIVTHIKKPYISTINQLKDKNLVKNIVVNEGYTADFYITSIDTITPIRLPTPAHALMALNTYQADAFVSARSLTQYFLKKSKNKSLYKCAQLDHSSDKYALAISKKYPELVQPIQNSLDQMEQDGTLNKLKIKWGFEPTIIKSGDST